MNSTGNDLINQSVLDNQRANAIYGSGRWQDISVTNGPYALMGVQAAAQRPPLHIEAVPGGFIVTRGGERQVAASVGAVARILREWAAESKG